MEVCNPKVASDMQQMVREPPGAKIIEKMMHRRLTFWPKNLRGQNCGNGPGAAGSENQRKDDAWAVDVLAKEPEGPKLRIAAGSENHRKDDAWAVDVLAKEPRSSKIQPRAARSNQLQPVK